MVISDLRRNLFTLVQNSAETGIPVEFTYGGQVFQLGPKLAPSKLARIRPMPLLADEHSLQGADEELRKEVAKGLRRDWPARR